MKFGDFAWDGTKLVVYLADSFGGKYVFDGVSYYVVDEIIETGRSIHDVKEVNYAIVSR